jgi:hypothetical protein
MDRAQYLQLGVFVLGGFLGLFMKPKAVAIFLGVVLGLIVAGLALGGLSGSQTMIWGAGIALMTAPLLGAIMLAGAVATNALVNSRKRPDKDESREN